MEKKNQGRKVLST